VTSVNLQSSVRLYFDAETPQTATVYQSDTPVTVSEQSTVTSVNLQSSARLYVDAESPQTTPVYQSYILVTVSEQSAVTLVKVQKVLSVPRLTTSEAYYCV